MPRPSTIERARRDAREGKSASTQAGEFVREEFHHIHEGKHGARSTRQAIAIGLSKARRAGVDLAPPKSGRVSPKVRHQAERDYARGHGQPSRRPASRRSQATLTALQKEPHSAASPRAISAQTHRSAMRRTAAERSTSARRAAATRKERL